jgi:hypothetical protein
MSFYDGTRHPRTTTNKQFPFFAHFQLTPDTWLQSCRATMALHLT